MEENRQTDNGRYEGSYLLEKILKCNESSAVNLLIFKGCTWSWPILFPACEREISDVNPHFQEAT